MPLFHASVLALLLPLSVVLQPYRSKGIPLAMVDTTPRRFPCMDDRRQVLLQVGPNGDLRINSEPVASRDQLAAELERIFRTRAERLVFFIASKQSSVSDAAAVMDIAQSLGIHVVAVTEENLRAPTVVGCGIIPRPFLYHFPGELR